MIETVNTKTNEKTLTAAAKAVLKNKEAKNIKSNVKTNVPKQKVTVIKPPTVSLSKSIDKSQKPKKEQKKTPTPTPKQQKQKAAAAKANIKTRQQEQVVKWRAKDQDVEMLVPVVIGKRKKDVGLQSEAKTKKKN